MNQLTLLAGRYHNGEERDRARTQLSKAIKFGDLRRPKFCDNCGKGCKPEGHHDNYDEALVISWLCRSCHARRHSATNLVLKGQMEKDIARIYERAVVVAKALTPPPSPVSL